MYDLKWLRWVARDGLADLVPAVKRVFDGQQGDHRLHLVFGASPLRNLLALAVLGVLAGPLLDRVLNGLGLYGIVNSTAVILVAVQAALIRRYLFRTEHASPADFPWLAASVMPAALVLCSVQMLRGALGLPDALGSAGVLEIVDGVIRLLADVLAVAAAYTVAMATLCYRRNWVRALWDLALRLFIFQLTVWIMVLVLVEIGIIGPIVSALIGSITGWYPPQWIGDLADIITYTLLMGVVLLAVISAAWIVCRDNFSTLLEEGEVDVLESMKAMSVSPEARAKQVAREEKRGEKREERAARKAARKGRGRDGTHA